MSEDLEKILRNSLDAVDRGRRWATLGVAALFLAILILSLATFFHVGRRDDPGRSEVLFALAATQMLFVACCTAAVIFHITRMTKAILRALESRKRE